MAAPIFNFSRARVNRPPIGGRFTRSPNGRTERRRGHAAASPSVRIAANSGDGPRQRPRDTLPAQRESVRVGHILPRGVYDGPRPSLAHIHSINIIPRKSNHDNYDFTLPAFLPSIKRAAIFFVAYSSKFTKRNFLKCEWKKHNFSLIKADKQKSSQKICEVS